MLCAALKSSDSCQMKPQIHNAIITHVISGRVSVGLLSNNGRKNIVGSPQVIKSDRRQPTGLRSACHPIGTYVGTGGSAHAVRHMWFFIVILGSWCGRGDLNSHGLRPTDFKSVMSTIPSRPHERHLPNLQKPGSGDSPKLIAQQRQ